MPYGICPLSLAPVRATPEDSGEMRTQLLYGEHFKVLEQRKFWSKIRIPHDGCEGWVCNKQIFPLEKETYQKLKSEKNGAYSSDLVAFASNEQEMLIPVLLGSSVAHANMLGHRFEGTTTRGKRAKSQLIETALLYLNAPYLWGGKTPFGIDGAGFTQMVYRLNGHNLLRYAADQATQGEALSFIEESEAGDLAFFDNREGVIDHVGIIMNDNYIIHAHGKVRIDRLDHTGIFNTDIGLYSHPLRVIKKIV